MRFWLYLLYGVGMVIFFFLPLSGCAHLPAFRPIETAVPVAVPCHVEVPPPPDYYVPHLEPNAPLILRVKAMLGDLELKNGYIAQLKAAANSCSE